MKGVIQPAENMDAECNESALQSRGNKAMDKTEFKQRQKYKIITSTSLTCQCIDKSIN